MDTLLSEAYALELLERERLLRFVWPFERAPYQWELDRANAGEPRQAADLTSDADELGADDLGLGGAQQGAADIVAAELSGRIEPAYLGPNPLISASGRWQPRAGATAADLVAADLATRARRSPAAARRLCALAQLQPERVELREASHSAAAALPPAAQRPPAPNDRELVSGLIAWAERVHLGEEASFGPAWYFRTFECLRPVDGVVLEECRRQTTVDECYGFIPHAKELIARDRRSHPDDEWRSRAHFLEAISVDRRPEALLELCVFAHTASQWYTMDMDALSTRFVFDPDTLDAAVNLVAQGGPTEESPADGSDEPAPADSPSRRPPLGRRALKPEDLRPRARILEHESELRCVLFSDYKGLLRRTYRYDWRVAADASQLRLRHSDEVLAPYDCGIVY